MKNIQKTNEICYCLGGSGEISPPKGSEKNTACTILSALSILNTARVSATVATPEASFAGPTTRMMACGTAD